MESNFKRTAIETISILGAGWVGMPLGKSLVEKGYRVKAATTSTSKAALCQDLHLAHYPIKLMPTTEDLDLLDDFLDADVLVISLPPTHFAEEMESFHLSQIKFLKERLDANQLDKVIYLSSTSVYAKTHQEVDENSPLRGVEGVHRAIQMAEKYLLQAPAFDTTVLRLGGLFGYNRVPGKYFAGKSISIGHNRVNFVHRDDVIRAVEAVIEQEAFGNIFNVVAPIHPTRQDLYTHFARQQGFAAPIFEGDAPADDKWVSSQKIKDGLGFKFKYPDPMFFPVDQ